MNVNSYQFCGPGTKLKDRLAKNQEGINELDRACKEHDISYSKSNDLKERREADRILENKASTRLRAKDSSFGEKSSAWIVANAMKIKRKTGMGMKKVSKGKKISFRKAIVNPLRKHTKGITNLDTLIKRARAAVKNAGGRDRIIVPRVIPVPKSGGFLPLVFAGLAALGSLIGGGSAIAKAVTSAKQAQQALKESQRHNRSMEAIALGKKGSGLYLKQYRKGLGLFLHQSPQTKNY